MEWQGTDGAVWLRGYFGLLGVLRAGTNGRRTFCWVLLHASAQLVEGGGDWNSKCSPACPITAPTHLRIHVHETLTHGIARRAAPLAAAARPVDVFWLDCLLWPPLAAVAVAAGCLTFLPSTRPFSTPLWTAEWHRAGNAALHRLGANGRRRSQYLPTANNLKCS